MEVLSYFSDVAPAFVTGAVCGLLFAYPPTRKWSVVLAVLVLTILGVENPDITRLNLAIFTFTCTLCSIYLLHGRWLYQPLDPSIPEIVRDFFAALEPFQYVSISWRRQAPGVIAVVLFAIVMIPPLTWIAGTLISGGAAFYFFRREGQVLSKAAMGIGLTALSIFCAVQLLKPIREEKVVEPAVTESRVEVPPNPAVLHGAFLDGTSATYASKFGVVRTEDGGVTWKVVGNGRPQDFLAAYFIDTQRGWRSHVHSTEMTEDSGRTWSQVLSGPFMGIAFADSNTGFLVRFWQARRCLTIGVKANSTVC